MNMTSKRDYCPTCGQALPQVKAPKLVELSEAERAQLSDEELRTYYAKRAPLDDLRFLIVHRGGLEIDEGLVSRPMAEIKRRLPSLRAKWREQYSRVENPEGEKCPEVFARVAAYWQ